MSPVVRRRAVLQSGALAVGTLAAATLADAAVATSPHAPATIPGVRFWRPRPGHFALPAEIVVVVAPEHEALAETAHQLARDLGAATGRPATVVVRHGPMLERGEILLRRGTGRADLGAEGYRLDVGPAVLITAPTRTGVYYGGRSLLQMVVQGTEHRVPAGTALDGPRYAERGLMVDLGRTHRTEAWLAARIRELGYLKLNRLHLQISDDEGFRVECRRTPGAHSEQHLSQAAVKRLVALGQRHHVTIVPGIQAPARLLAGLAAADTRAVRDGLLHEIVQLFPGRDVHLGPAWVTPADTSVVRMHRKRARVWSDEPATHDLEPEWRTASSGLDLASAYETWDVADLRRGTRPTGATLSHLADASASAARDAAELAPQLRIMAQQTWGSAKPARSYAAFAALDRRLGNPPS